MEFITDAMLPDAISAIEGEVFDAHMVEKRLLRLHTVAVTEELLRFREREDVLQTFNAQLARSLDPAFRGQIDQIGRTESENLGGRVNLNITWRKLVPTVTATEAV
jgi:hypothetical protein